jgi:hypothetical protein
LFLAFFSVGPGNIDTFFAVLILPSEGRGKVSRLQNSDSLLPLLLEGLLQEGEASQLPLHLRKEEEVRIR